MGGQRLLQCGHQVPLAFIYGASIVCRAGMACPHPQPTPAFSTGPGVGKGGDSPDSDVLTPTPHPTSNSEDGRLRLGPPHCKRSWWDGPREPEEEAGPGSLGGESKGGVGWKGRGPELRAGPGRRGGARGRGGSGAGPGRRGGHSSGRDLAPGYPPGGREPGGQPGAAAGTQDPPAGSRAPAGKARQRGADGRGAIESSGLAGVPGAGVLYVGRAGGGQLQLAPGLAAPLP